MAKELSAPKYDPNTEIFQMRAQWKKAENCGKQWNERWSWLLDEQREVLHEIEQIKQGVTKTSLPMSEEHCKKSLKPLPITSAGIIGWLATKPDCQLEIYTPWKTTPPTRLPDAWADKNYVGESH